MRWDETPIFARLYHERLYTFMDEPRRVWRGQHSYTGHAANTPDRDGWGSEPVAPARSAMEARNG